MGTIKPMSPQIYNEKRIALDKNGVINKINKALEDYASNPTNIFVEITLDYDYPMITRNEVAREFIKAGWLKVYHRSSSDNGESSIFTEFIFLTEETCDKWEKSHYKKAYKCITENDL